MISRVLSVNFIFIFVYRCLPSAFVKGFIKANTYLLNFFYNFHLMPFQKIFYCCKILCIHYILMDDLKLSISADPSRRVNRVGEAASFSSTATTSAPSESRSISCRVRSNFFCPWSSFRDPKSLSWLSTVLVRSPRCSTMNFRPCECSVLSSRLWRVLCRRAAGSVQFDTADMQAQSWKARYRQPTHDALVRLRLFKSKTKNSSCAIECRDRTRSYKREKAATVCKQAKLVLGEEDFRKRPEEAMAESVVRTAQGGNKATDRQVHRRTIPGGFQRETGRRCRFCSTPPWYGSMQVARPGPYLGHPKIFSGINSISALFNASMRLGVFHASQELASVTLLLKNFPRPQQLQANFKSHVPV